MPVSRRTLIERIDRFIAAMEKFHREPDAWESQCVWQALADIAQGDVGHAEDMMILARTTPDQRTAERPPGVATHDPHPRVTELRAQLQSVRYEQVPA
jgi:hypothetical protein